MEVNQQLGVALIDIRERNDENSLSSRYSTIHNVRSDYAQLEEMMAKSSNYEVESHKSESSNVRDGAISFISKMFFLWIYPLAKSLKMGIKKAEFLNLGKDERTLNASEKLNNYWQEELKKHSPSLLKALWASSSRILLEALLFKFFWAALMLFMNSYMIYNFIQCQFNFSMRLSYNEGFQYFLAFLFILVPFAIGLIIWNQNVLL
jgi:hypothetical protein